MIAFLGLISILVFIIYLIMSIVSLIGKKGTFKRNALIAGVSFVLVIILMAIDPNEKDTETVEDNENTETENVEVEQNENEEIETEEPVEPEQDEVEENRQQNEDEYIEETDNDEVNNEEALSWDDFKDKERIVGKSDKDFSHISKSKPTDVRNDKTGNWRKSTLAEDIDIEEYALSYQELHMKEDEVHHIINFTRNTTTWLNEMNGLLYVDIKERVDKEEHDASTLGSGMILKSYVIYPDGDIEEIHK